jgi:hypothetical protein
MTGIHVFKSQVLQVETYTDMAPLKLHNKTILQTSQAHYVGSQLLSSSKICQ